MKPFIYLSVLLITAGSAFGLSDYFKAKKNGTLARLYKEEVQEEPIAVEKPVVSGKVSTPLVAGASTVVAKETVAKPVAATKKMKKTPKPKKLSFKMFTRGDEFIPPPIVEEPVLEKAVAVPVVAEEPVIKEQPEVKKIQPVVTEEPKSSRPSITKMFSRAAPPKRVKKAEVKTQE